MNRISPVILACVLACTAAASAQGVPQLPGVWVSARTFGPVLSENTVFVSGHAGIWYARIGKTHALGRRGRDDVTFSFPQGNALRIPVNVHPLIGQWIQPASPVANDRYASPVSFTRRSDNYWQGQLAPLVQTEHLYLSFVAQPTGGLKAFVRNPESNLGAFVRLRDVSVDGNTVRLKAAGKDDIVAQYDPAKTTLAIQFPQVADAFVFERGTAATLGALYPRAGVTRYAYRQPDQTGDGWKSASLGDAGLDAAKIGAFMNSILQTGLTGPNDPQIQSVLIARHGKLVLDEYFAGFDRERPHDERSAGKSITTLMVGRAIEDGGGFTPQTAVYPFFREYAPFANDGARKQAITVADLMTMSTGYNCDDNDDATPGQEDTMQSQSAQPDWYKYTLDLPMIAQPGTKAVYCSAGINLLGGIISKTTHRWLPDYFYERFAQPMQFGRYALPIVPPPLNTAYMAGGGQMRPRDFLKFGQLFLDRGRWNGHQIVGEQWLQESVVPRAALTAPGDYGFGWHLGTFVVGGKTYNYINAGGNGGQLLYVIPQLDLAVMINAGNYGQYPVWNKFPDLIPTWIIPAVKT